MRFPTSSKTHMIRIGDLRPHPVVQRARRKHWIDYITTNFDPDAFGQLWVAFRDEPPHDVVVGQHRLEAARNVFGNEGKVPCLKLKRNDVEYCAKIFGKESNTKKMHSVDKFRIRIIEQEPVAVEIARILRKFHFECRISSDTHSIRCTDKLEEMYGRGGSELLTRILELLRGAWPDQPKATDAKIVLGAGLAILYLDHHSQKNVNGRLVRQCSVHTAAATIAKIEDIRRTMDKPLRLAAPQAFVGYWNTKLRYPVPDYTQDFLKELASV